MAKPSLETVRFNNIWLQFAYDEKKASALQQWSCRCFSDRFFCIYLLIYFIFYFFFGLIILQEVLATVLSEVNDQAADSQQWVLGSSCQPITFSGSWGTIYYFTTTWKGVVLLKSVFPPLPLSTFPSSPSLHCACRIVRRQYGQITIVSFSWLRPGVRQIFQCCFDLSANILIDDMIFLWAVQ